MQLSDLIQTVTSYSDATETETLLTTAYNIASEVHQGYQRINGEPFLSHCLAVASILAEWHAPPNVIAAALLHDIANPDYSHGYHRSHLEAVLSPAILHTVDVVIDLNKFVRHVEAGEFHSEADVRDFRYTMAGYLQKDRNAVIIKFADRLHNLRTISALTRASQERTKEAVLALFVPLLERLGMGFAKRQLEDCCFEINNAAYYQSLQQHRTSESFLRSIECVRNDLCRLASITNFSDCIHWQPAPISEVGNAKSGKSLLTEAFPLRLADGGSFVILADDESDCYRILGIIHRNYTPVTGQMYDFIGNPKENGYRSLHTQVMHTSGNLIQIVIRTHTMNLLAEYGIIAHWWHVPEELLPPLPVEIQHINGDMKIITPTGEAKYLAKGATVLDFAYHIHTDVGNHCTGAIVNGTQVELHKTLQAGDTVEILGNPETTPKLEWLDYVQTPQAISRIRHWLTQHERDAMITRGQLVLNRELQTLGLDITDAPMRRLLQKVAAKEGLRSDKDLMASIAVGKHIPTKIADTLKTMHLKAVSSSGYVEPAIGVNVLSPEDAQLLLTFARCCEPTPPDDIVGYHRNNDILVIHKRSCKQLKEPEKLVQVKWSNAQVEADYVIVVEASNHPGLASEISSMVTMLGIDMPIFTSKKRPDGVMAETYIYLGKTTLAQRNRIKHTLEEKSGVTSVEITHSTLLSAPSHSAASSRPMLLSNPYGPRLAEGSRFYGREIEYERVAALLREQSQSSAILLWGQKRIGKTSFVLRLQERAYDNYLPVYLDLQGKKDGNTTQFLYELMTCINTAIRDAHLAIDQELYVSRYNKVKKDPLSHFDIFMTRLQEIASKHPLVIILDEFQCLCSLREEEVSLNAIISRLRSHSQHGRGLHFILSGGGLKSQLTEQCGIDSLFNITYDEKLGCLEENAARHLIKDGLTRVGNITDLAIDLLVDFTSCHPFYLQLLCSRLFEQAQEDKMKITQHFLAQIIQEWILQTDDNRFRHYWEGTDTASARRNKLILSAIANVDANNHGIEYDHLLSAIGSIVPEQALIQSLLDLTQLGVVKRYHSTFAIEVKLFVRWLRQHWPLEMALREARWS